MKPLIPYLFFNKNCREAINFYQQCFGGELQLCTYADAPELPSDKNVDKNDIMHAFLKNESFSLMASDWPGNEAKEGNNVQLSIDGESKEQLDTLFNKLAQGGKITQPLENTFWGAYFGMLIDKFGIHWMLNFDLKK